MVVGRLLSYLESIEFIWRSQREIKSYDTFLELRSIFIICQKKAWVIGPGPLSLKFGWLSDFCGLFECVSHTKQFVLFPWSGNDL